MTYEYNLRRLFLPPIESLPIGEQLTHYRQRDLVPSHLYRLGTSLFGRSSLATRRRVFDAEHFPQHNGVNHYELLNKSLDGRAVPERDSSKSKLAKSLSEPSVKLSDAETEYKKWISDRKMLRTTLDSLGANEKWLLSKERTPLESTLLAKLRTKSRKEDPASAKLQVQLSEASCNSLDAGVFMFYSHR